MLLVADKCMHLFFSTAAGNAFCESAKIKIKTGSRHEAATNYVDAGNCYKKADPNGKINNITIDHHVIVTY